MHAPPSQRRRRAKRRDAGARVEARERTREQPRDEGSVGHCGYIRESATPPRPARYPTLGSEAALACSGSTELRVDRPRPRRTVLAPRLSCDVISERTTPSRPPPPCSLLSWSNLYSSPYIYSLYARHPHHPLANPPRVCVTLPRRSLRVAIPSTGVPSHIAIQPTGLYIASVIPVLRLSYSVSLGSVHLSRLVPSEGPGQRPDERTLANIAPLSLPFQTHRHPGPAEPSLATTPRGEPRFSPCPSSYVCSSPLPPPSWTKHGATLPLGYTKIRG